MQAAMVVLALILIGPIIGLAVFISDRRTKRKVGRLPVGKYRADTDNCGY